MRLPNAGSYTSVNESHIRVAPIKTVPTYWTYRTTIMQKDTVALKGAVVLMDASSIRLYSHPLKDLKLLQYVYGKSTMVETTGKNPIGHNFLHLLLL